MTASPQAAEPGNARGRATRRRLLVAGWDVLDELRLEDVFEGLPARRIALAAGSTERAVRHHFHDGTEFARALLELPVPAGFFGDGVDYGSVAAIAEVLGGLTPDEVIAAVRAAAEANWREVTERDDVISLRRQLLLVSRTGAHPELRARLRDEYYGRYLPLFAESYRAAIEASGRQLLEPFTLEQYTAVLAALSEGLLLQWIVDPERITTTFVVDACVVVALALTAAPDVSVRSVADLEVTSSPPVTRIDPAGAPWARAAHPVLSTESSPTWTRVAAAAGVEPSTLRAAFPSLRSAAALAFGVHLERLRAVTGATQVGRGRHLSFDVVCELIRVVRTDPLCAVALSDARRAPVDPAVTAAVPLDALLAGAGVVDRRMVRRVVDVALTLALCEPGAQPAELAAAACAAGGMDPSAEVSSPS